MTHIEISNMGNMANMVPLKPDSSTPEKSSEGHQIDDNSPILKIEDLGDPNNADQQLFFAPNNQQQQFLQSIPSDHQFQALPIQNEFMFAQYGGFRPSPTGLVPMGGMDQGGRFPFPLGFPTHLTPPPPQLPDHPLLNCAIKRSVNFDYLKVRQNDPKIGMNSSGGMVDVSGDKNQFVKHESSSNSLQTNSKLDLFKENSPRSDVQAVNESKNGKKRSSKYRGVTKHRRSGRWEAHIWVKELGRQVYLGGYENEDHAAEAYDVAAIKCKGAKVKTNFDISKYSELIKCMDNISLDELIMAVRRQSQGFARGTSSYRGVTYHPSGRWESRIGIPGSKHIYLGLYELEADAAKAYDRSLVRLRGSSAATNFALSDYRTELAEYHKMQQLVLMGPDVEKVLGTGPEFERWIKHGYKSPEPQINQFNSGQVGLQQQGGLLFGELGRGVELEDEQPSKRFKSEVMEQVGESSVEPIEFLQNKDIQMAGLDTDMELYKFQNDIDVPLAKIFNPKNDTEIPFEPKMEDC